MVFCPLLIRLPVIAAWQRGPLKVMINATPLNCTIQSVSKNYGKIFSGLRVNQEIFSAARTISCGQWFGSAASWYEIKFRGCKYLLKRYIAIHYPAMIACVAPLNAPYRV